MLKTKRRPILFCCHGQFILQLCRTKNINYKIILADVVQYEYNVSSLYKIKYKRNILLGIKTDCFLTLPSG